jgi:Zn-dependent protease with chaperone function
MGEYGGLILGLINLGGAVVVTGMFLYYSLKREEKGDLLAKEVMRRIETVEEAARSHNKEIADQFRTTVQGLHDDLKGIINDHIDVTRENVRAVSELRGSIEGVKLELARATGQNSVHIQPAAIVAVTPPPK